MKQHHLTQKMALTRLKQWEAITNLCLQMKALIYKDKKLNNLDLLQKVLSTLTKEKTLK